MIKKLKTKIHTIFMLIGPSGSGKTTFAKEFKNKLTFGDSSKNFKANVQYISSDQIRRDLLGNENLSKFDNVMTEASSQTFELLFTKLNAVTSYPINAEFVILDTTALSEEFRQKVIDISKKNHYNLEAIVFDYNKVEDYQSTWFPDDNPTSGKIIASHMKRLKRETFKTLNKRDYKQVFKIKNKSDFMRIEDGNIIHPIDVEIIDKEKYLNRFLQDLEWITIGDVHGCYDELIKLLESYGFVIKNDLILDSTKTQKTGLIFVGDIIDKAPNNSNKKVIDFIHKNIKHLGNRLQLVLGNHEEMVWKWITNHKDLEITESRLAQKKKYYNTSELLEQDEETRAKFLDIFHNMKSFVRYNGLEKKSFIVTHAPCETKYLGKMDNFSVRNQFKCISRSKNKDKKIDELVPYLMEEAVKNQPIHIFGHLSQNNVRTYKNKVCIDTGCIYGRTLTGYSNIYGKPFVKKVSFMDNFEKADEHLASQLFSESKNSNVVISELSDKQKRRLDYIIRNDIEYIGGTISPADKDEEKNELESFENGLEYYKQQGIKEVCIQPKYMGSRSQLYLTQIEKNNVTNIEKCYATSRNGYKITQDLDSVFLDQLEQHKNLFSKYNAKKIVMDGELMPWSALGKGLISEQFGVIDKAIHGEIDTLQMNGFDEAFSVLKSRYMNSTFSSDKNKLSKKELMEKYGSADYQTFKHIESEIKRFVPLSEHKKAADIYSKQLEIYGQESVKHYKPFRILKIVTWDDEIIYPEQTPSEHFNLISNDDCCVVDLSNEDDVKKAKDFYENLTTEKSMEGVVIKPNLKTIDEWSYAPMLKVRNKDYLTIIYGYDMYFEHKFNKLIKQKNISKKLKMSKIEYSLGEEILRATDINIRKQAVSNMIFENEKEKSLDPRL